MVQVNATYAPQGLQFIGISLDDNVAAMNQGCKQTGFTWPQMCDGGAWRSKPAVAWGVNSIPQTFIIGPDGVVLWRGHPANLDGALADAFKNHPPQLVEPQVLAEALAAADKIDAAVKAGDQAGALKLMAGVPVAARADTKLAARLIAVEAQLETFAAKDLAEIEVLIQKKQYPEATERLSELASAVASQPSGAAAKKRLAEVMANPQAKAQFEAAKKARASQAELEAAKALQGEGKNEEAFLKFKAIASTYPGTPAADAARAAVTAYEKDPALAQKAADAAAAGKAPGMAMMAQNYLKAGRADLAKEKYKEIILSFPGSTAAKKAQASIDEIDAAAKKP